jgi:multidrug efflux pump subunit AcrA (membrane-fusion protein)
MRLLLLSPLLSTVLLAQAAPGHLVLTPAQQRQAGVQTAIPVAADAGTQAGAGGTLVLSGTVVAPPQAVALVSAPLGGVVQAVLVQAADGLRAGQPVARLHSPALMAAQREYLQLQLQATQAQDRLQRDEQLAADGIIAAARVVETRNTAQQARLAAQERRQALRLAGLGDGQIGQLVATATVQPVLSVTAGAAGRVVEVLVQPGQQVEAGALLLRLARPLPLGLALQATTAQAAQLRPGAAVRLADCDLTGTVRGLVPAMQGSNQAVIVQVALARAADCVQPNQVVTARVALPAAAAGALQVRAAALLQLDGRDHVFVQAPGLANGFRPQPVQLLARQGALATVRGLAADARVVVAGVAALKGAWMGVGEIAPVASEPPPAAAAAASTAGAR